MIVSQSEKCNFNDAKMNLYFFIYFSIMFTLYTITIVQLLAQIMLLIYVFFSKIKNGVLRINKISKKNIIMYIMWFGLLTLVAFLSQKWAYGILENSKTLITIFRIFIMGGAIVYYIDSKEKMYSVLKSFIYSTFLMGIAALLVTPFSQYGKSGIDGFGSNIGMHRNGIGMISAPIVFICFYLNKEQKFKHGKFFMAFFIFLLLCSGSRSAIIQLILLFVIYIFSLKSFQEKIKKITIFLILFLIGYALMISIPYLRTSFYDRIVAMIEVYNGNGVADSSASGRRIYKILAWRMFKQKPLLGYGVDGFITYFDNHRDLEGRHFGTIAYSHCNYAELAADFGIVGLIIWYWMIIYIIVVAIKYRKHDPYVKLVLILILTMIIKDTATINWNTHIATYLYIIVFCLLRVHVVELKAQDRLIT